MSDVTNTGFQKMECGDMHHVIPKSITSDVGAGLVDLQVVGTDPAQVGPVLGAEITAITGNYRPAVTNPDGTFLICIETASQLLVTLFDGSDFVITIAQATAYLGQWYPARIWSVNVGTVGDFSVGY